ncbi:MAG: hypothetical protein OSJ43_11200 [Oscillospiraceae bacterium]|nr:hypothetical protein [Oscillospiraceae bacterium]
MIISSNSISWTSRVIIYVSSARRHFRRLRIGSMRTSQTENLGLVSNQLSIMFANRESA